MSATPAFDRTLSSGLRFVGERSERSPGVALAVRLPVGAKDDPANKFGIANLVKDVIFRGTKKKNARKLADAFDYYGIRHSEYTGTENTTLQIRFLPEHLDAALDLLREVLSQPTFPKAECETARIQAVQEIKHLDDDPFSKVFVLLKELYFGSGWGHSELGTEASLPEIAHQDIAAFWKAHYIPAGSVVAAAGKFDPEVLQKKLEALFGHSGEAWPIEPPPAPPATIVAQHSHKDSEQTQIAMAFPAANRNDPNYYAMRLALGALAGGMSSRLFTEVREKRSLVYSVGAQASAMRSSGIIYAYAGTTTPRAKETLDVIKTELRRLGSDLTQEEIDRARIGLKANILMDQESTGARARELLDDVFYENRVLPVAEVISRIEAVKLDEVAAYWNSHPFEPYALVTLGREAVD